MSSYVLKEMPGSIRVFCYDRRIEISSPHVFAQCDKRLINHMFLGNAGSPEGSLLRCGNAGQDSHLCAGKPGVKRWGHHGCDRADDKFLLRA